MGNEPKVFAPEATMAYGMQQWIQCDVLALLSRFYDWASMKGGCVKSEASGHSCMGNKATGNMRPNAQQAKNIPLAISSEGEHELARNRYIRHPRRSQKSYLAIVDIPFPRRRGQGISIITINPQCQKRKAAPSTSKPTALFQVRQSIQCHSRLSYKDSSMTAPPSKHPATRE